MLTSYKEQPLSAFPCSQSSWMKDIFADQLRAGNHSDVLLFLKTTLIGQNPSLFKYI